MTKKIKFTIIFLLFNFNLVYAATPNLDKIEASFLKEDYVKVINECENILSSGNKPNDLDRVYYFLGLSYMKLGYYLKATDTLELITKEFNKSKFLDAATLNLADIYFLQLDFNRAASLYEDFLNKFPESDLLSLVYLHLGQVYLKLGKWQETKSILRKLEEQYPLSFEAKEADRFLNADFYFTVQAGSFSKAINAQNFLKKLKENNFEAYIKEENVAGRTFYRVRIGKFENRKDAETLAAQLSAQDYPVRIFP